MKTIDRLRKINKYGAWISTNCGINIVRVESKESLIDFICEIYRIIICNPILGRHIRINDKSFGTKAISKALIELRLKETK